MAPYRIIEVVVYALLRFLPFLFLMYYVFRESCRLPRILTVVGMVLMAGGRCICGLVALRDPAILARPNPGILVLVALCLLFIKGNVGKSLFSMFMLVNISGFTLVTAKYLEGRIFPDYAPQLHRWTNSLLLLLVEAAVLIPLFFYVKKIFKKSIYQTMPSALWHGLWVIPFTLYAVWYRNSYFAEVSHEALALDPLYMIYCLLISGGGMVIYNMVARLINERAENARLREKEYAFTLQQTQYQHLQERIEEARTAKHDMRQHLHMISAYLADQKYDELEAYINSFRRTIPEGSTIAYCDHYATNALLQYFAGLSKEHDIGFSAHVALPAEVSVPDDVLAVLLGNLLENAVQAAATEARPLITVRGKLEGNALFFKVINTFTGKPKKTRDGLFLSTKHEGRGIGLRSVRGIVGDYNGLLKIRHEDGLFTVSVLLNVPASEL